MSKHTHGPWHFWRNQRTFGIYMAEGMPVAKVHGVGEIIEPRKEADARLIAASPELLDALIAARDYLSCIPESAAGGDDHAVRLCRKANAAIAKATGGES